jgi:hypothetical protein
MQSTESNKADQYADSMSASLKSLTIQSSPKTNVTPKMTQSPQPSSHLQDEGLTCLLTQLRRVNDQLRHNNALRQVIADYEEEYKRELAASLAKSMVKNLKHDVSSQWVKYYDNEVGAEYFYNTETKEASWVDPHAA